MGFNWLAAFIEIYYCIQLHFMPPFVSFFPINPFNYINKRYIYLSICMYLIFVNVN